MSTTRERREARAERLEEWAAKRRGRAAADQATADQMYDAIPFGQPILVGHHSERRDRNYRDRAWNTLGRAVESSRMADSMESRAANIRAAADHAIYSDDDDAVERIEERIADLEAERQRITDYNKSCRKAAKTGGTGDTSLLSDRQRAELVSLAKHSPYQIRAGGAFPAYATSNLSGNIKRYRDRLERLKNPRPTAPRANRYAGACRHCDETVAAGAGLLERIDGDWTVRHADCEEER